MGENGESTTGENVDGDNSDCLFDLLFKSQALRMNDQRCALDEIASSSSTNRGNVDRNTNSSVAGGDSLVGEDDSFFDLLIGLQVSCFSLSLSLCEYVSLAISGNHILVSIWYQLRVLVQPLNSSCHFAETRLV